MATVSRMAPIVTVVAVGAVSALIVYLTGPATAVKGLAIVTINGMMITVVPVANTPGIDRAATGSVTAYVVRRMADTYTDSGFCSVW